MNLRAPKQESIMLTTKPSRAQFSDGLFQLKKIDNAIKTIYYQ